MELISSGNNQAGLVDCNLTGSAGKCGLYSGRAGLAMVYFLLSRYYQSEVFEDKARLLLDEISENIASVEELNFASGLAGIGWAIEWIVQNKFMEANTNDVLEDIDDTIYKSVLYAPDKTVSLSNGTLSKATYFLKRYQSVNPGTHRFKTICHQECLMLLTDEIKEKTAILRESLNPNKPQEEPESLPEITDLAHSMIFLAKIFPYKMNVQVVEDALYANIKHIEALLQEFVNSENSSLAPDKQHAILLMVYGYYYSGIKLKCRHWQKQSLYYLNRVSDSELFYSNLLKTKIESLPIFGRLFFYTREERYRKIINKAIGFEDLEKMTVPSLTQSTDLLTAISCLDPSFVVWDEALLYS